MIDLTPLEVRNKNDDFKRGLRGYDVREVDAFLGVVADALERRIREGSALGSHVEELEQQLETYQARERALNDALLAAQELREETRLRAERDAAVRVREAEARVAAVIEEAEREVRLCQDRIDDLKAARGEFLGSMRKLFERFDEYLDFEDTRFEAGTDDLGHLIERLRADPDDGAGGEDPDANPSITRVGVGDSGAAST